MSDSSTDVHHARSSSPSTSSGPAPRSRRSSSRSASPAPRSRSSSTARRGASRAPSGSAASAASRSSRISSGSARRSSGPVPGRAWPSTWRACSTPSSACSATASPVGTRGQPPPLDRACQPASWRCAARSRWCRSGRCTPGRTSARARRRRARRAIRPTPAGPPSAEVAAMSSPSGCSKTCGSSTSRVSRTPTSRSSWRCQPSTLTASVRPADAAIRAIDPRATTRLSRPERAAASARRGLVLGGDPGIQPRSLLAGQGEGAELGHLVEAGAQSFAGGGVQAVAHLGSEAHPGARRRRRRHQGGEGDHRVVRGHVPRGADGVQGGHGVVEERHRVGPRAGLGLPRTR